MTHISTCSQLCLVSNSETLLPPPAKEDWIPHIETHPPFPLKGPQMDIAYVDCGSFYNFNYLEN